MATKQKRSPAKTGGTKRPTQRRRRSDGEIVYTPPKHFDRFRFFLRLVTVVAVVLALTLGMAIFFKVEVVTVSGMEKYTAWEVREASGIQDGENLLTLNKAKAGGKITTALPYVDTVKIRIKLPDTVNIEITELDVVYAIEDTAAGWWLMDADGILVENTTALAAESYTRVSGVKINPSEVGLPAVAAETEEPSNAETEEGETEPETTAPEETVQETFADGDEPITVYAAEQLGMAITVLRAMENCNIIGKVTVVDVTDPYNLQLWYQDRYQVIVGDTSRLEYKLSAMENAAGQMTDYQRGKLDVSFTQWPDKVGYTPFEDE